MWANKKNEVPLKHCQSKMDFRTFKNSNIINPVKDNIPFLSPLKTLGNQRFQGVRNCSIGLKCVRDSRVARAAAVEHHYKKISIMSIF